MFQLLIDIEDRGAYVHIADPFRSLAFYRLSECQMCDVLITKIYVGSLWLFQLRPVRIQFVFDNDEEERRALPTTDNAVRRD